MANRVQSNEQIVLEQIARKAANSALKAETAKLTRAEKASLAFQVSSGTAWAIFEWYVPGRTQRNARIMVRAMVERSSMQVVLVRKPALSHLLVSKMKLAIFAILAPVLIAGAAVVAEAVFRSSGASGFPLIGLVVWATAQVLVLLIIYMAMSHTFIKLPDGERVVVVRQCIR